MSFGSRAGKLLGHGHDHGHGHDVQYPVGWGFVAPKARACARPGVG